MTNKCNIFIVQRETHIDEILINNQFKLITLVMSHKAITDRNTSLEIKKFLKRVLSIKYTDVIFLFVDLSNYFVTDNKYTHKVSPSNLPFVQFILNKNILGTIDSTDVETLEKIICSIKEKIDEQRQQPKVLLNIDSLENSNTATKNINSTQEINKIEKCEQKVNNSTHSDMAKQSNPHNGQINVGLPDVNNKQLTHDNTQQDNQNIIQQKNPLPQTNINNNQNLTDNNQSLTKPIIEQANLIQHNQMQTDPLIIHQQLLTQKKLEEVEKIKKIFMLNELKKIQKRKEEQENKSNRKTVSDDE